MPADPTVVARVLDQHWPDAACELQARDPWELLIAAILSARTSDVQVNKVMAALNEHVVGPAGMAIMDHRDLERVINRVPLFRQKARAIVEAARAVVRHHGGQVPRDAAALIALPGVGRKVAAVVLGNAFGIPAIAADVHVTRLAKRLGWAPTEEPRAAETAVSARFPPADWVRRCHQFIRLGREHCKRTTPRCERCPLSTVCPQLITPLVP